MAKAAQPGQGNSNDDQSGAGDAGMTAAEAAKLVCREVPIFDDKGKPTGKNKQVSVHADEVLSFRDCGTRVVVVTKDGQKLIGEKAAK